MRLARFVPFIVLAACTSSHHYDPPPRQNAEQAFGAASRAMEAASARLGSGAGVAPVYGDVDVSVPCSRSGSLAVSGTFDAGDYGASFDIDATFNSCREAEGTLDGTLHWDSSADASGNVHDHWGGTLDWFDQYGSWSCVFDLTMIVDGTGVHYSGSICGYDAQADLGL